MATIANTREYRRLLAAIAPSYARLLRPVIDQAQGIINRYTRLDGTIDERQGEQLQLEVGELVQRVFVGPNMRSAFGDDGVTALAPYPQMLNEFYVQAVYSGVDTHHRWLKKRMPDDVWSWLNYNGRDLRLAEALRRRGVRLDIDDGLRKALERKWSAQAGVKIRLVQENEFLRRDGESIEAYRQRLADLRIFQPNPLAELDPARQWVPMHRWQDSRGYRLSDRIWNTSVETRRRIDALIAEALREGRSARDLARDLEQYLLPGRSGIRTNRPYGSDGSFDAMRLARTEIARAANQANYIAGYLNPYVGGIDLVRSPNGDGRCPICPRHATIGMGGERIREPYSVHSAVISPLHPHCKCHVRNVMVDNPAVVTERLRAVVQDAERDLLTPVLTPVQRDAFMEMLIGRTMMNLMAQVLQLPLI